MAKPTDNKLDEIVLAARRARELRDQGYREQALKLFAHVCARCGREFDRRHLQELTVHHRDHNHDYNPPDGSNWELLCVYCHDNEHQRYALAQTDAAGSGEGRHKAGTHHPFEGLKDLLGKGSRGGDK